jgi:hypothetical protein
MFDISAPVWVKGTVVRHDAVNPHTIIVLDETTADGQVRRWSVEGPSLQKLTRMGVGPDFIETGDVLEICGFPPKPQFSSQRPSPDSPGYPAQVFHGHVLVLPDGQMSIWGSYGKLENCIRPEDQARTWIDFLNADAMARDAWCRSRLFVNVASLPPTEFVDEISRRLNDPCD